MNPPGPSMVGTPGGKFGIELLTAASPVPDGLFTLPALDVIVVGGRDADDAVTWLDKSTLNDDTELLGSDSPLLALILLYVWYVVCCCCCCCC